MSNQWYQPADDLDDLDDGGQQNTVQQLPKGLRTQLKKLETENKQLRETNDKLLVSVRQTAISQALSAKGVDPKVAKLVPADVEPTAEAVQKWLEEYADLFPVKASDGDGGKPPEGQDGSDGGDGDNDGEGEAAQMALIAQAANGAQAPGKQADLMRKLTDKSLTQEQLLEMISAAGGGLGAG